MASHGNVDQVNAAHADGAPRDGAPHDGDASGEASRFRTFAEFWPYYVGEHRDPKTRRLHFVGTTAAGLCLAGAIASRRPLLLLGAMVAGYGPAWASHFFVEKNRPATFKYPLWSLLADFKMWSMIAKGTMDAEVERVAGTGGVASATSGAGSTAAATATDGHAASDDATLHRSRSGVLN